MSDRFEYKVGYGKPPFETRFKKGQSGNRKGPPKQRMTVDAMIAKELKARVTYNENGSRNTERKIRLIIKQAINKALSGNFKPLMLLLQPIRYNLDQLNDIPIGKQARRELDPEDLKKLSIEELTKLHQQTLRDID